MNNHQFYLLPEWHPQDAILMAWPEEHTDWKSNLSDVKACYQSIINSILANQKVVLLCKNPDDVSTFFNHDYSKNLILVESDYNDTWTRDYGPIAMINNGQKILLNFKFNGWGEKFSSYNDDAITGTLFQKKIFDEAIIHEPYRNFVLEGGSIESDGAHTLLTTTQCLLAPNRNQPMTLQKIDEHLRNTFNLQHILWLNSGLLEGDDTDGHIDTLARFCDTNTIAYVGCDDPQDEHYYELIAMEEELKAFKDQKGQPYNLIKLPMAEAQFDETGNRLPATYANFLIINNMVLMPGYDSPIDNIAATQLQKAFPRRKVIVVNCNALIQQHGSLHCVTMQIPEGFLNHRFKN